MCCWYDIKQKIKTIKKYLNVYGKVFLTTFFKFISISILIVLGFFISTIFFYNCEVKTPSELETQEIFINGISLSNWTTWITLIGGISAAFWSIHQFNKKHLATQQEKASMIAQDFADNLIERMSLISEVLMDNPEVKKIVQKINNSQLHQFSTLEAKDIFKAEDYLDKFINIINSSSTQEKYESLLNTKYNLKEQERFDSHFNILIDNTLNRLEAICMNISSKAAGSEFIYESLHQIFLSTIEILYIRISYANENNVDKYYINIISVYNMWNFEKLKDIRKLNKTNKKITKLQKQADEEIRKLLNKQTKTV